MKRAVGVVFGLWMATAAARAASEDVQNVPVTITGASGGSVYLDKGVSDGIYRGMHVRFFPPGAAAVEGFVEAVSTNSARVDLPEGVAIPPIGTTGEVDTRGALPPPPPKPATTPAPSAPAGPAHPPWSMELEEGETDAPLLAPFKRTRPEERQREFTGRVYGRLRYTHDEDTTGDNRYVSGRTGIWTEATNLAGRGGRLLFAGEVDYRGTFLASREDSNTTDLRLDRFSYALGGQEYDAYRFEGGRFASLYLPELGLVDGAELALQFDNGTRAGVGGGIYPVTFDDQQLEEDAGFHVFGDYQSPTPGLLSALLGYQKTWHNGEADRDLLLGRLHTRVGEKLMLHASMQTDIYTSEDTIKGSGVQLTQAWMQARYSPDSKKGISASYSHTRWPELKRAEYRDLPVALVRNGRTDRGSFSGWVRPLRDLRLTGRLDVWTDQDDDGTSGELAATWSPQQSLPTVYGAVFYTDGAFNAGEGFRVELREAFRGVDGSVSYEWFQYDVSSVLGTTSTLVRQLVRLQLSLNRGSWYYNVSGDFNFGDADNGSTLSVYVVYRF